MRHLLSLQSIPVLLLGLSGALLLVACGGGEAPTAETGSAGGAAPAAESAGVPVRTITVQPETVVETLDLPADLEPDRRAVLAAEVPGTVETLAVEEGDRVAAGRVLATVDTRALEQSLAEARAVYDRALDDYERAEALFEKRSVTRSDLVAARSEKEVAEARLGSAELQLEKSRLEAPWSGQVASTRVEVGDYVVPGQAMVELVDVDPLVVRAPVPAADVPYVEVGSPVTLRISSLPGEELSGRVVRLAAELDPGSRTLSLEVEIPNPGASGARLKPGMLARVTVPRRTIEGALMVPLDALVDLEDRKAVYVVESGTAARRTVRTGPAIGDRIVIEEGLAPGDRVIVQGQGRVAPGEPVEPIGSIEPVEPTETPSPSRDTPDGGTP